MERKITHYVVKPEHIDHFRHFVSRKSLSGIVELGSPELVMLTEAKVLDLWCTPCYQKEKVTGWYIVLVSGNMVGPFTSKDAANSLPDDRPSKGVTFIDQEIE